MGVAQDAGLKRVLDSQFRPIALPAEGLAMSRKLAEVLGIKAGERVSVEVKEGSRPVRQIVVSALVDDFLGMSAYMRLDALNALMREGPTVSGAYLSIDPEQSDELYARLKRTPGVGAVTVKSAALKSFRDTLAESILIMVTLNVGFAAVIAFGVVYNTARVSLSERGRELASLRVLGLTRAEISYILLGELAIVTLLAIPLGCVIGYGLAAALIRFLGDFELIRFPLVISPRTYGWGAVVVMASAALSGLMVRRRLDHLDLVEVLKTRE
jgi:putative ABC transport system permease protein